MTDNEKLQKYEADFRQLSEGGQDYVLAIQQALLFAQNTIEILPPNNDDPLVKKGA